MKTIMIVDDKDEVRRLVKATLSTGDFKFLEADNGLAAVEVALREKPDLIMLDVMMPGSLDGFGACQQIKAQLGAATKVIMLTARGQEVDKVHGKEVGADEYFIKPFSPLDLLDKIYTCLDL